MIIYLNSQQFSKIYPTCLSNWKTNYLNHLDMFLLHSYFYNIYKHCFFFFKLISFLLLRLKSENCNLCEVSAVDIHQSYLIIVPYLIPLFHGQLLQSYSRDLFFFLYFLLIIVSAMATFKIHHDKSPFSVKPILYLNRHQTEEWKGWMQVSHSFTLLLLIF